ncbi:MAG: protein kinase [Polyangia bacterium]
MTFVRTVVDRSYLLGASLGEGGMGAVFQATSLLSQEVLALKLVAPSLNAAREPLSESRFAADLDVRMALAREFQTLASLHHPNVIRVQSYGFDERLGSYFTMELLNQPQTILDAAAGRTEAERCELLAQLLRALTYIHRRGVIHRDLKPSEVATERGAPEIVPSRGATSRSWRR